jgi:hypothetical protein
MVGIAIRGDGSGLSAILAGAKRRLPAINQRGAGLPLSVTRWPPGFDLPLSLRRATFADMHSHLRSGFGQQKYEIALTKFSYCDGFNLLFEAPPAIVTSLASNGPISDRASASAA